MAEAMISLEGVSKRFAGARDLAVRELTLDVQEGELVVLVGPSGCGKTTTMRMINRLIEPTSGSILVEGRNVLDQDPVELRRRIGYVIQSVGLLPHRTVEENISTVPRLLGWGTPRIKERVEELAGIFELDEQLLERYPSELSGGQQQRVGVARALAADPPVMLMDEPFGAVDPIVRARLQDEFLAIQERLRKTVVFVTHDIDEAIKLANRIALLKQGGVLEQFASPEEILRAPASDFVKDFIGAERGLKRLSLIKVKDAELEEAPVVEANACVDDALEKMDAFGEDWASVLEDGRLLGWVDVESLRGCTRVAEASVRQFGARLHLDSSLRQALDSIVTSRTHIAVVVGPGDSYRGTLSLDRISKEIVS